MCGIVGYVGRKRSVLSVAKILKHLEYRGYDSAGVAYNNKGKIELIKAIGPIDNMLLQINREQSNVCICHTRWATHGKVTTENAHPQLSNNKNYAVVHNGIIENYKELREQVGTDKFSSDTDTEVIVNLLETIKGNTFERLSKVCKILKGTYAMTVIDGSGNLFAAKNKSPMYVCKTRSGYMIASDIVCFDGLDYFSVPDNTIIKLTRFSAKFFQFGEQIKLKKIKNTCNSLQLSLNGYKHFMEKEIDETPNVLKAICKRYIHMYDLLNKKDMLSNVDKIILTGCGTAYHSCLLGANWFRKNYNISAQAYIASELRYSNICLNEKTLVILVSQSGETADTLAVGELAKEQGCKIYSITNVEYSSISKLSDVVLPLCAGPEIAVASTKAYCAMIAVLYFLCFHNIPYEQLSKEIMQLTEKVLECEIDSDVLQTVSESKRIFFIGRRDDGVTAQEGALKLREIAYLDACGYFAGELKHGTIALIEPGVVVIAIITDEELKNKTLNAVEEVKSRGAEVIVLTNDQTIDGDFKKVLIPKCSSQELVSILSIVPLQKLAYLVACKLNKDPDKPRNLAKSVTVE